MIDVEEKGLGFFPGREDDRDWLLERRLESIVVPKVKGSKFYFNPMKLDQGSEGACVGFGHVQGFNSDPKRHKKGNDYGHEVYREATYIDDWPNEDWTNSSGTSVRAGAEVMLKRGHIPGYAFTYSVQEIATWILNKGPVIIGVDWYAGMDRPSQKNDYFIKPTGARRGGHCTLIDGVRWNRDSSDYFRVLNSWGPDWGFGGRARITAEDLHKLLSEPYAVGCTWVES